MEVGVNEPENSSVKMLKVEMLLEYQMIQLANHKELN